MSGSNREDAVGTRERMKELLEAELLCMRSGSSLNSCLFSTCTCMVRKVHAIQGRVINADSVAAPGTVSQVCQLTGSRLAIFCFDRL